MTDTLIGFSTQKYNPVSWLVRRFTGSKASHAWFLYFDADFDQLMVLEAHELGFRLLPYSRFQRHNRIVAVVTPSVALDRGLRYAATWLGTRYDFSGLFGMVVVLFGRLFRKRWRNLLESSHAMFCSELVVRSLQESGYPGVEALDAHATSPQDLMDFLLPKKGLL